MKIQHRKSKNSSSFLPIFILFSFLQKKIIFLIPPYSIVDVFGPSIQNIFISSYVKSRQGWLRMSLRTRVVWPINLQYMKSIYIFKRNRKKYHVYKIFTFYSKIKCSNFCLLIIFYHKL